LAFPDHEELPTGCGKFSLFFCVTSPVSFQLWFPKIKLRLRKPTVWAPFVTMPKATMNKNSFLAGGKNNIRIAWDRPQVKSVTIPH
jgi:hypothetical protein